MMQARRFPRTPRQAGGSSTVAEHAAGTWGDPKRFAETYWSEVKGSYFTGDGVPQDKMALLDRWTHR